MNKDGQLSQYAYDDANRRIRKTVNGATVNYLYNGPDIQAEYQNWSQANASYTHGPNTDDPVIRVTAANDANYFHQDGLGSVVATTDQSGNLTAAQLYDAWGKPHPSASLGNLGQYGYTGREPDETGMMYYRARYYDPAVGRFTQRDPAGMPDGVNRYAYVANDPVNYVDPEGEVANWVVGALFNAGVGLAVNVYTGASWQQTGRDFGVDLTVGALTSGVAGISKIAKVMNSGYAKGSIAAVGEVAKGYMNGSTTERTTFNAFTSALVTGSGVVGKVATAIGRKIPGVQQLVTNPSVAALLQAPAIGPSISKVAEKTIGSPISFLQGVGKKEVGMKIDDAMQSSQSLPAFVATDPSAGGLFGSCNSVVCVNQSNSNYSGSSSVLNAGKIKP